MTPLKKLYGFLLVGLLAVSCSKDSKLAPAEADKPVTVKVNQLARIKQNVSLSVDSIADSRCPANVVCIWYGNAMVKFSLTNDTQKQSGELCIGQCGQQMKGQDSVVVQLGTERYEVILSEVQPFPGTKPDGTPQEAVITVKQKN